MAHPHSLFLSYLPLALKFVFLFYQSSCFLPPSLILSSRQRLFFYNTLLGLHSFIYTTSITLKILTIEFKCLLLRRVTKRNSWLFQAMCHTNLKRWEASHATSDCPAFYQSVLVMTRPRWPLRDDIDRRRCIADGRRGGAVCSVVMAILGVLLLLRIPSWYLDTCVGCGFALGRSTARRSLSSSKDCIRILVIRSASGSGLVCCCLVCSSTRRSRRR